MNRRQELNHLIKDCITDALLQLMRTKPFAEITITELTRTAGVGRVSFYRNFESKQDILEKHLAELLREWGREFEQKGDANDLGASLFRHFYKYKTFYLLLYQQGLSGMIYDSIRRACRLEEASTRIERYSRSTAAGLVFGMVDEWMRQGMQESPEELLLLTAQAVPVPAQT